ncbi:MAG: hypothetical protein ACRDN0_29685 [Trebonia sp.]
MRWAVEHDATWSWASPGREITLSQNLGGGQPVLGYLMTATLSKTVTITIDYANRTWSTATYPWGYTTRANTAGPEPQTPAQAADALRNAIKAGSMIDAGSGCRIARRTCGCSRPRAPSRPASPRSATLRPERELKIRKTWLAVVTAGIALAGASAASAAQSAQSATPLPGSVPAFAAHTAVTSTWACVANHTPSCPAIWSSSSVSTAIQPEDAGDAGQRAVLALGQLAGEHLAVARRGRLVIGVERRRDGDPGAAGPGPGPKGPSGPDVFDMAAPGWFVPLPRLLLLRHHVSIT